MAVFHCIHAADLHLGSPFKGLEQSTGELAEKLRQAGYTALSRLTALCIAQKVHALILSGDVYDHEGGTIKAQFALRDACKELERAGIAVFMVHGNHDPANSRADSLQFPANVHIFSEKKVESLPVTVGGEVRALIHGISHAQKKVTENLSLKFHRNPSFDRSVPQIGVLHCSVSSLAAADYYAPCSVSDLLAADLDYWALGHIHERQLVHNAPPMLYAGNIQGLHCNENGAKGCYEVLFDGDGTAPTLTFHSLAPVLWHIAELSLDDVDSTNSTNSANSADSADNSVGSMDSIDAVERALSQCVADVAAQYGNMNVAHSAGRGAPDGAGSAGYAGSASSTDALGRIDGVMLRIVLTGRTPLAQELHDPEMLQNLTDLLRADWQEQSPWCFVKDIISHAMPQADMEALLQRDDVLGESLRQLHALRLQLAENASQEDDASNMSNTPNTANSAGELAPHWAEMPSAGAQECLDALQQTVLAGLWGSAKLTHFLHNPSREELLRFLDDAERICIDLLEQR